MFLHMKEKDILRFEGPLGSFILHENGADLPIIFWQVGLNFPNQEHARAYFYTENTRDAYE